MQNREEFVRKINEAFASCDTKFIARYITNDVQWKIVGEKTISGKADFEDSLERMKLGGPMKIRLEEILTQDNKTMVEGIVEYRTQPGRKKSYAFCDIYVFEDSNSNKFRELRTYVSQIRNRL